MGQENTSPRKINKVEGAAGQVMKSGGPGVVETWGYEDYGLSFEGIVTGLAGAPKFQCSGLADFGDEYFKNYWIYVIWDSAGGGAAPQGEMLECTGYSSATGDFTVGAFTPAIAVGDKVLLFNESQAAVLNTVYGLAALKTLIDALPAGPERGTDNAALAASWTAGLATILANFSALRIGYLDELAAANLPTDVTAIIDDLANGTDGLTALKAIMDTSGVLVNARSAAYGRLAGVAQIAATTIDLNQAAAPYTLFTGTTQDVVLEKLVIRMPNIVAGGALTSISIQTDDTTPQIFITAAQGAVANLVAEAQLSWAPAGGITLIKAGTLIRLTIAGGAHGVAYVCDVVAVCRAVVAGGNLA